MNGLSNLPPGVTGNEPEIAGYDESEMEVECGVEAVSLTIITSSDVKILKGLAYGGKPVASVIQAELQRLLSRLLEPAEITCPFTGEVTVFWDVIGTWGSWDCPLCGNEHRIEAPERDEDEGSDR